MLVKLKSGQLVMLPSTHTYEDITYSNYNLLPEEVLLLHGWKHLIPTPAPEETKEGFYWKQIYREADEGIYVEWEETELPFEPEPEPTIGDILPIVEDLNRAFNVIAEVYEND